MAEGIIGGFEEPVVSPWTLMAYNQGYLGPQDMAAVDLLMGRARDGGEAELLRQAATNPRVAAMLQGMGGITGFRAQVDALIAEENGRL